MPLSYEEQFTVLQYECDPWNKLSPGSILRRAQEIATAQCETLGIAEELYLRTNTIFMLSRLTLEINRLPELGETVRMETRAYGMHRALFHRYTAFYDAKGNTLCDIDSRWVMIDTNTRRILRKVPVEIDTVFPIEAIEEELDITLPKAETLTRLDTITARYSLCDRNQHINNTKYADLICDYLPVERLAKEPLRKLTMYYRIEIPMGNSFTLSRAEIGENGYYFLASEDEKRNFEGYATF